MELDQKLIINFDCYLLNKTFCTRLLKKRQLKKMKLELLYTRNQTVLIRQKIIDRYVIPTVEKVFTKYPKINSCTFAVAQYWDDQARDEVHAFFLYSVLDTPDWEAFAEAEYEEDNINLPGFRYQYILSPGNIWDETKYRFDVDYWNGLRGDEIAAFAAFCKEGSHQCMAYAEAYTPYAVLRRREEEIEIEIVGKMLRPWLDGVRPEAGW